MAIDPYRLIEETAARVQRRLRENVLVPALPPAVAVVIAASLGRLPVELGVAATIGFALGLIHLANQQFERRQAATFLDSALGAKENFLTLATIRGDAVLRSAVEERATAIASSAPPPLPPPRNTRPALLSGFASLLLLAFLWWLPEIPLVASGAGSLDRIAAELGASSDTADRKLGAELAALSDALRDPSISKDDKQKKIAEMIQKIEQAEAKQKQSAAAGSSGSGGESGKQGKQENPKGEQQGEGKQSGAKQESASGQQGGASGAKGEAKKQLEKMAGELAGGEQKNQQQQKSEQGTEKKPEASGGGIKGPEDSAKERKPGDRDATGNQPGKNPDQSGGNEKPGGAEGQAKADQAAEQQPNPANAGKGTGQGSGESEGASQRPSQQPSDKPAERFYKPGENAGGRIVDGRYVRIRIPEEERRLAGTEEVGTPGEAVPEVPFGNAPMPPPGGPGEVGTEQPVPLEYRGALGGK